MKTSKSFSLYTCMSTSSMLHNKKTLCNGLHYAKLVGLFGILWKMIEKTAHVPTFSSNPRRKISLRTCSIFTLPSWSYLATAILSPMHCRFSISKLGDNFKYPTKLIASSFCNVCRCSQNNQLPRFQAISQLLPFFTNIEELQVKENPFLPKCLRKAHIKMVVPPKHIPVMLLPYCGIRVKKWGQQESRSDRSKILWVVT